MRWHLFAHPRRSQRRQLTVEVLETRETPSVDVLTYHNDIGRTGLNSAETILTPANVNSNDFGLLYTLPVDGKVDAEPLYLSNLTVNGATHNVVFVATEHDSVYAFDTANGSLLWHDAYTGTPTTILPPGEVPSDPVFGTQVTPEIGITSTPVIDPSTNTMYLVAMSKNSGGTAYFQRLVALDVATGQLKFGGRTTIAATYGGQTFDPKQYKERDALLLLNGIVYVSFASHSDHDPYTAWLMGYSASTLAQVSVLDTEPSDPNAGGSYWNSANGWGSDGTFLYNLSGNGEFDTTLDANGFPANGDYGNAVVKVSPTSGLQVVDYFTMSNTVAESSADTDLGSGGILILPDLTDSHGVIQHLALAAGKDGNIYVLNRDNMGKFSPAGNNIYQELSGALPGGIWSSPAYFNGAVYYGPEDGALREFTFTNALLNATPAALTSTGFFYPGTTPSISSNGTSNGIVWAYENTTSGPAVLHAYNAANLTELYNSNQAPNGRDHFGNGNKFITPMIADGQVYAATTNSVAVFGLLSTSASDRFVQALYSNLLGRAADPAGLTYWTGVLNGLGDTVGGRAQVAADIEASPEYRFDQVNSLYGLYLKRSAVGDPGAQTWANLLGGGWTVEEVAAQIAGSPEFVQTQTDGSIGSWLDAFYRDALSRPVDSGGLAGWSALFASGASRAQIAEDIFTIGPLPGLPANEYQIDLVDSYYAQFLGRSGSADPGSLGWAQALQQGAPDQAVIAGILGSQEFYNKNT